MTNELNLPAIPDNYRWVIKEFDRNTYISVRAILQVQRKPSSWKFWDKPYWVTLNYDHAHMYKEGTEDDDLRLVNGIYTLEQAAFKAASAVYRVHFPYKGKLSGVYPPKPFNPIDMDGLDTDPDTE